MGCKGAFYVATKLEIAEYLQSGPKTLEELANLTKAQLQSLEHYAL